MLTSVEVKRCEESLAAVDETCKKLNGQVSDTQTHTHTHTHIYIYTYIYIYIYLYIYTYIYINVGVCRGGKGFNLKSRDSEEL